MIRRLTALFAIATAALLFADGAGGQVTTIPPAPATATLAPQRIAAGDSSDHIDLAVNRGAALASAGLSLRVLDEGGFPVTKYAAGWSTSNPAVATVAAGTVVAIARGEAYVSAKVLAGGRTLAVGILVCVADTNGPVAIVHQWPAVTVDPASSAQPVVRWGFADSALRAGRLPSDGARGDTVRYFAALEGKLPAWPVDGRNPFTYPAGFSAPCIHWRSTNANIATVNRRGVVTITSRTLETPTGVIVARYGPPAP